MGGLSNLYLSATLLFSVEAMDQPSMIPEHRKGGIERVHKHSHNDHQHLYLFSFCSSCWDCSYSSGLPSTHALIQGYRIEQKDNAYQRDKTLIGDKKLLRWHRQRSSRGE
jgi:hypothetical protein